MTNVTRELFVEIATKTIKLVDEFMTSSYSREHHKYDEINQMIATTLGMGFCLIDESKLEEFYLLRDWMSVVHRWEDDEPNFDDVSPELICTSFLRYILTVKNFTLDLNKMTVEINNKQIDVLHKFLVLMGGKLFHERSWDS